MSKTAVGFGLGGLVGGSVDVVLLEVKANDVRPDFHDASVVKFMVIRTLNLKSIIDIVIIENTNTDRW